MKYYPKQAFLICMLLSITMHSQSPLVQARLKVEAERFIRLYNTGDTLKYKGFLQGLIADQNQLENTMARYRNTFNSIGRVELKRLGYPSSTEVEIFAQEYKYDSWWKFTLQTDENQRFLSRRVLPIPLPEFGLKNAAVGKTKLQSILDDYIENKLGDGFAGNVYISKRGKTMYNKSFGSNIAGKPNTFHTEFGLASAGKMFTALAVLQLWDGHKLELDDSISKYLPNLKNDKLHNITIYQLLTHTSGMGDFFEHPLYETLKDSLTTSDSFLPFIEADEPIFRPGTDVGYSNTAFSLLGILIEKISGFSYQEYLHNNIFLPLGMKSTKAGTGAGGGTSTIVDMDLFLTGLKNPNLLRGVAVECLLNDTVDGHYGYGTEHHIIGGEHIVGHTGGFINECIELNMYPKSNQIVIILSNSNPPYGHFLSNKIKENLVRKRA